MRVAHIYARLGRYAFLISSTRASVGLICFFLSLSTCILTFGSVPRLISAPSGSFSPFFQVRVEFLCHYSVLTLYLSHICYPHVLPTVAGVIDCQGFCDCDSGV